MCRSVPFPSTLSSSRSHIEGGAVAVSYLACLAAKPSTQDSSAAECATKESVICGSFYCVDANGHISVSMQMAHVGESLLQLVFNNFSMSGPNGWHCLAWIGGTGDRRGHRHNRSREPEQAGAVAGRVSGGMRGRPSLWQVT